MSNELSSIGDWVNQLFDDIFYQPDDDKAIQAYEAHVATAMIASINHDQIDFDQYRDTIKQTRTKYNIIPQSNTEVIHWDDADKKGGAVAHLSKFWLQDKVSLEQFLQTTNLIVIVEWVNGRRLLTRMTEVWVGGYE